MHTGFEDRPHPGAALMARDAARLDALEADPGAGASCLWYRWERPTISLGRLQRAADAIDAAACARDGIPVVVRPTGGRAVLHAAEWTYGAVVPLDHPVLGGSLRASCRALVGLLARALERAYGLPARVGGAQPGQRGAAGCGASDGVACFTAAAAHELTVDGRKLAGSAQRRGRRALLQQGSLLVGPGHEQLARYAARVADRDALTRRLAAGSVTLTELLGGPPDPGPFRAAWREIGAALEASGRAPAGGA